MEYREWSRTTVLSVLILAMLGMAMGLSANAKHPKIDANLQVIMEQAEDGAKISAYVVLEDRLSYNELRSFTANLPRKERQQEVVRILKSHATSSQSQVLGMLRDAEQRGDVSNIRIIWAINTIAFQAVSPVIVDMAEGFAEIEKIYYDAPIDVQELLDDNGISEYNEKNNINLPPMEVPQPGLTLINAPMVWAEGDSGAGVIVANIDTGSDWQHPDLARNVWNNLGEDADGDGRTMEFTGSTWIFDPGDQNGIDDDGNGYIDDFVGWDIAGNDNNPNSGSHGTQTGGIICGDGTNGTETGVAPRAKMMILSPSGESQYWEAQQYAVSNGADVITSSLSYKWYFSPQPNYVMFREMTDVELAAGVFHSNSTSNDGNSVGVPLNISAPGNCPSPWIHPDQTLIGGVSSTVGVGNVEAGSDIIASSSPWGPWTWEDYQVNHPGYPYTVPANYQDYPYETVPGSIGLIKPDVSAPGNGTVSTVPGGGYASFSGTSGATPHVAGTAALMLGVNPNLEPEDVSRILQTTAVEKGDPGKDNRYGAGRIDAYEAYLQAASELADPGDPNPPTNVSAYSDFNTPTSIAIDWDDPTTLFNGDPLAPNEFTIEIERDGVLAASVNGGLGQYTDTGLNDGQLYAYVLYAKLIANDSTSTIEEVSWIAGGSAIPAAPANLVCAATGSEAQLTWDDPTTQSDGTPLDDLAGLNVYRGGVFIANVAPGTESYTDFPPQGFTYAYYVTAEDNETPVNESAPSNTVECFVGDAPSVLVWVGPDAAAASAESGDSIFSALVANGEGAFLSNDLFEFGTDLSIYDAIFVVLGIFSNNHVLGASDPEAAALDAYLSGGGRLFLEGGDCFNYDPDFGGGYNIRPWFDLDSGNDGSGDLFGVIGLNDLSAFQFAYVGENNWMDELVPLTSTAIWQNDANTDISGVFHVGFGSGRAIGVVPSFGGFVDNPAPLFAGERQAEEYIRVPQAPQTKVRPERDNAEPFQKKAAYYPELKAERRADHELFRLTSGGVEIYANTKVDLMAAYLGLFSSTGDPEITVTPAALLDTLLVGGTSDLNLNVANSGGSLAGDLTYTITENPAVDWLSASPSSGTVTANNSDDVTVSLDASALTAGSYTTTLEIASNAVNEPLVMVTVDLLVNDAPGASISPDTFDVTLEPGMSTSETLTISNGGSGPLDFEISIEGVENASVDIIANDAARKADVLAVGKEVPVAELLKRNAQIASRLPVGPAPVDKGMPSVSHSGLSRIGGGQEVLGEEIFGSNANGFTAGPRTRGNLFSCTTSTTLTEHRLYLSPSISTQMWFLVYEGDAQVGIYDLISAADVTPQGPGEGWYSSGDVNVPMEAGKYYMIVASFEQSTTYYNQQDIVPYPIPASFGELTAGAGWNYAPTSNFPPDPTQDVPASAFGAPVAYYQTIVTGAGTSWLSVDPTLGTVPAGGSSDVTVTFDATGLLGGDYNADIVVTTNDPANPELRAGAHLFVLGAAVIGTNPAAVVFPNDVFANGIDSTSMYVVNSGNGQLSVSDITSSNTVFSTDMTAFDVPPFDSVAVTVYFQPTVSGTETGTLTISSNATNEPSLDVSVEGTAVDPPVISVDTDSIVVGLAEGDSTDVPILITNNGGADLDWSAMAVEGEARMGEPVIVEGYQVESHAAYRPDLPQIHFVGREMWDLQLSFDMEAATGANGNAGAEFDGTYFYSTRWASNLLHKYDLSGNLVEEFSITGVSGLRDLAWDGTYMYGGNAANTIYQIDVATNTVVGTISSPVPVRHIAYDEGADGFWVGNWDTDIVLVDRSGTTVATITAATHGLANMYGSAYDGYSADGPYLWMFDQGPAGIGGESFIVQIDLNTLSPTGELYDVGADFAAAAPIAGGLWISEGVVEGTVSIGGVAQGVPDNYFVYELGEAGPGYFTLIGETSGTIAPGDVGGVVARMYGAPADTVIHGSIVITSNDPLTPMITIPVTIEPPLGIEDVSAIPTAYRVDPNYPNPFNPTTTIHYQLPVAGDVKLVIYNILGQKVRTLVQSRVEAGRHNAVWDGRNDAGTTVGSGVYVYRFEAGSDYSSIRKMILLK